MRERPLRFRTKLAAVAVAGSTAAMFGITGVTSSAVAACGSAQGANVVPGPPSPVYTSGAPAAGPTQTGYVGAAGSGGGAGGYVQATGTAGAGGVTGNVTASGTSPAQSGTVAVGNDGNETPVAGGVGVCQG